MKRSAWRSRHDLQALLFFHTPSQPSTHSPMPNPQWISQRWLELPSTLPPEAHDMLPPLLAEEHLLGLQEVEHARHKKSKSWLLVSTHRAWLFTDQGRSLPSMIELPDAHLARTSHRIARDTLDLHGEPLLLIPKLFDPSTRELIDLVTLEPEERAFQAAKILAEQLSQHHEASALLHTAKSLSNASRQAEQEAIAEQEVVATAPQAVLEPSEHEDPSLLPLTRHERILVWMARSAIAVGAQGQAIDHLVELTQLRPKDDLIASTMSLARDDVRWWLPIALAHEEARDFVSAAAVYERLYTLHPAHGAFLLSQARCLQQARHTSRAITHYEQYIAQYVAEASVFPLLPELTGGEEEALTSTGPSTEREDDFFLAARQLAHLYASRAEWLLAMETYITAIQHRPFLLEGYTLLVRTLPHVKDSPTARARIALALDLLQILQPDAYQSLLEELSDHAVPTLTRRPIPPEFARHVSTHEHEEFLTHPGEHMRQHNAQKWLSGLMIDRESTRDIERHCERLSPSRHTLTFETLTRLAHALDLPTPRCYLSHGMTGAQVFAESTGSSSEPALLLVGAAHLDEDHPQYLAPRPMAFALGAQLEHIRAGHLVLTSSEFWSAFRSRALAGGIVLLNLIPVGSALGKFADGIAGPLLDQLKKGFDNNLFQGLVRYLEKQVDQGAAHGQIQSAYESIIGALLLSERRAQKIHAEPRSLIKEEELADFARCAMYTADRFGLVACDDLSAAVEAILLLSSRHGELPEIRRAGLKPFLEALARRGEGGEAHQELAMRLSELFCFALSESFVKLRQALTTA